MNVSQLDSGSYRAPMPPTFDLNPGAPAAPPSSQSRVPGCDAAAASPVISMNSRVSASSIIDSFADQVEQSHLLVIRCTDVAV